MDVRTRKLRVTFTFLALIGLVILMTSFYVYNQIHRHLGSERSPFDDIYYLLPFTGTPDRVVGIRAAVLRSEFNADYLAGLTNSNAAAAAARRNYLDIATFWERQFVQRRVDVEVISDQQLLTDLHRFNVLVLPVVHCLSSDQGEAIKTFLKQGKGLILTHMTGNRDSSGAERGWSLTADITGGTPLLDLRVPEGEKTLTLHAASSTPLTANLKPGSHLEIAGYDQPIRLNLREPRTHSAAVWASTGKLLTTDLRRDSAAAFGTYLGGRFAWFGFTESGIPAKRELWEAFDAMVENAINWTGRRAVIDKRPWGEARSAATFAIMAQRDNLRGIAIQEVFAAHKIRPAFFTEPETLPVNRLSLHAIRGEVEFAPYFALSEERLSQGLDTAFDQRLQQSKRAFKELLDVDVSSFSLPFIPEGDTIDRYTRFGFDHIWITKEQNFAPDLPKIIHQPLFRRLVAPVLIFPSGADDEFLTADGSLTDPDELLRNMIREYDFAHKVGGLYSTMLHADVMGMERNLPVLENLLGHIRKSGAWIVSPSQLAEWWRKYENVKVRLIESTQMLTLMVSNEETTSIESITLRIFPNRIPQSISIRAERILAPTPGFTINPTGGFIDIILSDLGRRENRTYYIEMDFDPVPESQPR